MKDRIILLIQKRLFEITYQSLMRKTAYIGITNYFELLPFFIINYYYFECHYIKKKKKIKKDGQLD